MSKVEFKQKAIQYGYIALGVILLDIAFYFFIEPSKIVMGGMMGLSIVLEPYYSQLGSWFTSSIFLWIANGIVLIIGGIMLGKDFFIKTIFASLFSPLIVFIFEQTCQPDYFLSNVSEGGYYIVSLICGAVLSGLGLGVALKNNGSTGGLDVIQKIMSKYLHIPYSKTMYLTDWVIVLISGFTFVGGFNFNLEITIYGIFSVLAVSLITDNIVLNARPRRTAYIITTKAEEVKQVIFDTIGRGVTLCDVKGGYTGNDKVMVICTMEKNEAYRITELISSIDPEAFCFVTSTREIVGEYEGL